MTDQWERFSDSTDRMLDSLGWDTNVEVYQPGEAYTPGEGYDVSYPSEPTKTLSAAVEVPSDSADVDPGGTTEMADLTIYIRTDIDLAINDAGTSGEAKTGLVVNNQKYVIDTVEPQFDGMLALACEEVDLWR